MKIRVYRPFTAGSRNFRAFILSAMFVALCFSGSVGYAASAVAGNTKVMKLDMSSLSIAKQIEKSGQADVLVVLDDSDARAYASQQRKRLGLRHDDAAIVAEKARLFSQKKDAVLKGLSGADYTILKDYSNFPILYMRVDTKALARLKGMSDVKYVTEDRVVRPLYTDSQTLIGIPSAWTNGSGQTGTGTSIAVLDSGIDYAASGITACTTAGQTGCVAYDACFATGGCTTDLSHGTSVSGIVFQTAPDSEVLALDVFYIDGYAHYNDVISALNWVMNNYTTYNIVAVNMSFGENVVPATYTSPCFYDGLAPVISELKAAGIATVAASGDYGISDALAAPACAPDAVSVGAVYAGDYGAQTWPVCTDDTTASDQVACFSDSASFLSILAPGVDITQPGGVAMSGTSQAAPFVSGAIAVLKSQDSLLTVDQVVARLKATGAAVTDARNSMTFPCLDLNAAVSVSSPIILPEPSEYTFMGEQGGPNPTGQTMDIQNAGIGTMSWTFNPDPAELWTTAIPSSGAAAGTTTLSVDTSGFGAPGTYFANPQISATGALNTPVTVPVTLDLIDPAYSEDFESATLTNKFPWVTGGSGGSWTTVSGTGHTGTYAAQSPAMTDNQSSYLQVTLNVTSPGYVYFWVKTDTEPTYDNLMFYMDGNNEGLWTGWSGTTDWTFVKSEHEVAAGTHTFSWVYSKDMSGSQGTDTVWIDDIFFPPVNLLSVSPVSFDFGEVAVNGSSTPKTFTVTNMSGADADLGTVSVSSADPSEFAISADGCSGQVLGASGSATDSCTVDVTFNPASQADGKTASLSIPEAGSPAVTTASLSGTGGLKRQLTINKSASTGAGAVSSSPTGIDCGSVCSARFFDGSTVTLTATAYQGSTFTGWSGGGCSGTAACNVNLTSDTTVSATFDTNLPTADFSALPLSGIAPLTVTFADASSSNTSAWAWDFGDGGQSTTQNPTYTYTNPGIYSVSLTAANPGGSNTMTKNAYINVTCPVPPDDIRIPRDTSLYFSTVQAAFDSALVYGDTVEIHDGVTIVDTPSLNTLKTVTLRGGYDQCFTTSSGYSTIEGSLTVADGTLTVDRIIIK